MKDRMFNLFERYVEVIDRFSGLVEKFLSGEFDDPEDKKTFTVTCPHCMKQYEVGHMNFTGFVCQKCGKEFSVMQ